MSKSDIQPVNNEAELRQHVQSLSAMIQFLENKIQTQNDLIDAQREIITAYQNIDTARAAYATFNSISVKSIGALVDVSPSQLA